MNTYLGLDFGGTKLLIGEMDENGNILAKKRYDTGYTDQAKAAAGILSNLEDYLSTIGIKGSLAGAGIGIVGISNHETGEWISLNHIISGPPIQLAKPIHEITGVPCYIDNDVRSATTAELIYGAGKRSQNFIYINIGTGLAAGFVCGGHIVRGANNNSGEIGHLVVDMQNDFSCICGRNGCIENMISGYGFTLQIKAHHRDDLLLENGRADVKKLFAAADACDPDALLITDYAIQTLAATIMNLVRITDPDTVILGGGVVSDGWLLKKILPLLEPHTMRGVHRGVILSELPIKDVGLMGAASLGVIGNSAVLRPPET